MILVKKNLKVMFTCFALSSSLVSQAYIASAPEGKVLPKNVARARIVNKNVHAYKTFDNKGDKESSGLDLKASYSAFVAEYGLSDKLSFQLLLPVIYQNKLSVNRQKFMNSKVYKEQYSKYADKAANELVKNPEFTTCSTIETCRRYIDNGGTLPLTQEFALESGERMSAMAQKSIKNQIDGLIMNNLDKSSEGTTGIGDLEIGALYNWLSTEQFVVSSGLGFRFPTGKYNVPDPLRPIGGRLTEGAIRSNLDYCPVEGLWLSLQHQMELALDKGQWKRPSFLNPQEFNTEAPTDDKANERSYEKKGLTHKVFVKADYGFGALTSVLDPFALNTFYKFDSKAEVYLDGVQDKVRENSHSVGLGVSATALPYKIPLALDATYEKVVAGNNLKLAGEGLTVALKAYARF